MNLSSDRRAWLELRYEIWGLEDVRKELEQSDRDLFASPEVTEFAWAWVKAKETSIRRRWCLAIILMVVVCVSAGLIAVHLIKN